MTCQSCRHSYDGADAVLRCRIHSNGLQCSPEAADGCKRYEAAADQSPWFANAWCLEFVTPKSTCECD